MAARGQASIEWLALVLLVAAAMATGAAVVHPGHALRAALPAARAPPPPPRGPPHPLAVAYGARLAAAVRRNAPGLVYERGRHEVPVDPRLCRVRRCAQDATGATLFTHVVRAGAAV